MSVLLETVVIICDLVYIDFWERERKKKRTEKEGEDLKKERRLVLEREGEEGGRERKRERNENCGN